MQLVWQLPISGIVTKPWGRLSGRQVLAPLSSDWPAGLRLAKMVGVVMVDWLGWGVLVIIRRSDEIIVGAGIRVEMTQIMLRVLDRNEIG